MWSTRKAVVINRDASLSGGVHAKQSRVPYFDVPQHLARLEIQSHDLAERATKQNERFGLGKGDTGERVGDG